MQCSAGVMDLLQKTRLGVGGGVKGTRVCVWFCWRACAVATRWEKTGPS